jgi:hypothetical protein
MIKKLISLSTDPAGNMNAQLDQVGEGPSSYHNHNVNYGTTSSPNPIQGQHTGSGSFGGVDFQNTIQAGNVQNI